MKHLVSKYPLILAASLILGWWFFAFKGDWTSSDGQRYSMHSVEDSEERLSLRNALNGDVAAMDTLVALWEQEEALTQDEKVKTHLSLYKEHLKALSIEPLDFFTIKTLPQTFPSAAMLLALVPPEQIAALPRDMRTHTALYPESLVSPIKLNLERYTGEKLFLSRPDLAVIAPYSNPVAVQSLYNQGISLHVHGDLNTPEEILAEIIHLGNACGAPKKARLLASFTALSLAVTDCRTAGLNPPEKILYLLHHQHLGVPTPRTLTGHLLSRMHIEGMINAYCKTGAAHEWFLNLEREKLLCLQPDALIIASANPIALEHLFVNDAGLQSLHTFRDNALVLLDEVVQQTPSQHVALAYFDLYNALKWIEKRDTSE